MLETRTSRTSAAPPASVGLALALVIVVGQLLVLGNDFSVSCALVTIASHPASSPLAMMKASVPKLMTA